jgi:peptidoglycan-associated lipoprotein
MWVAVLLVSLALVSGFGCAKKQTAAEPAAAPVAKQDTQSKEDMLRRERELAEQKRREALAAAAKEISDNKVYFDYDKFDLKPEARTTLTRKAELLKAHPEINVVIEGNCDERGTNEYNLALGEKRAKAAFDFMSLMGVAGDRLKTVSYGEERPVCTDKNEPCYSKNRRDEFKTMY